LGREISAIGVLLKDFVGVFPLLDAYRVEVQEFFERPGLGPLYAFFYVVEGSYTDSCQLADLHLGQHGLLAQGSQPLTAVVVEHPLISH
jgi:hypothetical protein